MPTRADQASIEDFVMRHHQAYLLLQTELNPDYEAYRSWWNPQSSTFDAAVERVRNFHGKGFWLAPRTAKLRFAYVTNESEFVRVFVCETNDHIVVEPNKSASIDDDVVIDDRKRTFQDVYVLVRQDSGWLIDDFALIDGSSSCNTNPFVP